MREETARKPAWLKSSERGKESGRCGDVVREESRRRQATQAW